MLKKRTAIILAAGSGSRMCRKEGKLFLSLGNRPVLFYAIRCFEFCDLIDEIILVIRDEDTSRVRELVDKFSFQKIKQIIIGGDTRQRSVANAVCKITEGLVIIHDAARPFVKFDDIKKVVNAAEEYGAATLGVPVKDTLKKVSVDGVVSQTVSREFLWHIQTPQAFACEIIREAHANKCNFIATDDCVLVEKMGKKVVLKRGNYYNIKITTEEDLTFAKYLNRIFDRL